MTRYIKKAAAALGLKTVYKRSVDLILKWRGFHLLDQVQTAAFMKPYRVTVVPANRVLQPQVVDCSDTGKKIFAAKESVTDDIYVWDYQDTNRKPQLAKYGSVVIRGKVLSTDRTHGSFYRDVWKKDRRAAKTVPKLIVPFSHLQEAMGYGGYFDFVYFVCVKICRIKDALPDEDFSTMSIAYVPFNTPYEREYLQLLGINPDLLLDSRLHKIDTPRMITGNGRNWHPHLADIVSLKKHIEKKFKPVKTASNRIYISRSWRRCIKNEDQLVALLKTFNFVIIEDKQRSVTEQITIYHNASFILGPHGASFGNIIWCEPGTHLFELFSPNYAPDFFLYLSTVMGMKYSAYYEGLPDPSVNYLDGIVEDIDVSIPKLKACLENIFGKH